MAINCSSNALLDTLNAKKDLLNSKVAELQSAGAAAMGDLANKAKDVKDSLLAAVPVPPAIPNFKKELDALKGKVGKELADAKAAFKERWGDALPDIDIDGMIANVTSLIPSPNFDFCKDVPNVEAPKISADGKVEAVKVKAEEPIVAADIPKKVEVVVPTVVEKEKAPSVSPKVVKSVDEIKEAKDLMYRELNEYRAPYRKQMTDSTSVALRIVMQGSGDAVSSSEADLTKSSGIVGRAASHAFLEGITLIEYYNSGKGKRIERALIKKYLIAKSEETKFKEYNSQLVRFNQVVAYGPGLSGTFANEAQQQSEYMNKKITQVKEEGDSLITVTPGGHDAVLAGYVEIINRHTAIIKDLRNYKV
jgi:hypothetical protein